MLQSIWLTVRWLQNIPSVQRSREGKHGTYYTHVTELDAEEIVQEHLLKGRPVKRLMNHDEQTGKIEQSLDGTAFYKQQKRIALRNCGVIDPEDIDEYIGADGYVALAKVLTEMTPQQVIDEVKASGLRGRGGAGFSTGLKWQFTANAVGDLKYVCCNAGEGDPGAFMDRSVLEGDPYSVVEAMTIAGYAVGARQGYIYVRAEYPIAVERLNIAIKKAEEYGLLGDHILGTDFSFHLETRLGSGAFVCGEETAPNPVLSTMRNFREEYIAHVVDKRCAAGVCKGLLHYEINPDKCKGRSACSRVCPVEAISGVVRSPYTIDTSKCIKCGSCMEKCKFGAISKV